jgi:hypothetical protein
MRAHGCRGSGYVGSRAGLNQPQSTDEWGPWGGFVGDGCGGRWVGASGALGPLVSDHGPRIRRRAAGEAADRWGPLGRGKERGCRRFGLGMGQKAGRAGVKGLFPFSFFLSLLDSYSNMPQIQRRSSQAYASHKGKIWGST